MATKFVFGELLKREGLITSAEADLFDGFVEEVAWKPDAVIYLDCSPEVRPPKHLPNRPSRPLLSLP